MMIEGAMEGVVEGTIEGTVEGVIEGIIVYQRRIVFVGVGAVGQAVDEVSGEGK